jgi:hypothetical protein
VGTLFNLLKFKRIFLILTLFFCLILLFAQQTFAQGFSLVQRLDPVTATEYTGDKPQSKVWQYGGYWWTVIPVPASGGNPFGTYLFRLDGTTWTKLLPSLAPDTLIKADVKSIDGVTHILLKHAAEAPGGGGKPNSQQAKLISVEFVAGSPPTYQLWSQRPTTTSITLPSFAETATIDIDSQGRMWMATEGGAILSEGTKNIYVYWSSSPYSNWSSPIQLATGVREDEICAITAFGGNKMGILWSDQTAEEFRFRYRNDSDNPSSWQPLEIALSEQTGAGVADDHMNFAVDSRDGTIYAVVKSSYTTAGLFRLGLLVRPSNGNWQFHTVVPLGDGATRPTLLLNENDNVLTVCYTADDAVKDNIMYKESPLSPILFPNNDEFLSDGVNLYNDVTSTKQNVGDDAVILYSDGDIWSGVKTYRPPIIVQDGAGLAYHLNGINDQAIVIDKTSQLQTITSLTLEAWFKTNSISDQTIIFNLDCPNPSCGGSNWHEGYALSLTAAGKVKFEINYLDSLKSTSNYLTGTWTHIAATYDGNTMRIYINGILDASKVYGSPIEDHGNEFVLGARRLYMQSLVYDRPFNGSLDEIRVWNVVRSENDIRAFMCKKVDETNLPASLIAYWKFDTPKGFNIIDVTGHGNNGSLFNIGDFQFEWSGAAIGDESEFDYTPAGGSFFTEIGYQSLDHMEATAYTSTGATGIQIYRVDALPLRESIAWVLPGSTSSLTDMSLERYYGVKVIGSGTPTYDIVYHYQGHPGIENEATLTLAKRDNLFDDTWDATGAILNTTLKTLTVTGLTGTQFALASSGSNPLPVELAYFTGKLTGSSIQLDWKTETEVSNFGFDVERSNDGTDFSKIGFVQGNGNSNSPKYYSFSDNVEGLSGKIYYRLKQIDTDGTFDYSNLISVEAGVPTAYELFQNYPNPFNPNTIIRFQLPEKSNVSLRVFNSLGEQVAELVNEEKEPGYYEVNFNANNLASGVYVYIIQANGFFASNKMILIK